MINQKFKLKIDVYGKIFLCLPIVITLAILAIGFPEDLLSLEHWTGVILALLPYSLLVILHAMFSYASVEGDYLRCHFIGLEVKTIEITNIKNVVTTEYGFSYMALSKEKTLITTQSGAKALLSLKDTADFMRLISARS